MEKADIDAAIILEAKVQERVRNVVNFELERILVAHLGKILEAEKAKMLKEVALDIARILRTYEKNPMRNMTFQEMNNAICEQKTSVQEGIPTAS